MATVLQSFLGQAGIKIETVIGTYRAPAAAQDFIFYTSVKVEDIIEDILDESFRGQAAKDQGFYPGFRSAKVTIQTPVAQAPTGHFLKGFLGQVADTGGGDPYTHTFTELDTAAPPTYTVTVYDATTGNARALVNCIVQRVHLTMSNKGLFTMEVILLGKFASTANAKPTAVFDTQPHYLPWQAALTLAGGASTKLIQWELTCEREVEPVFGFSGTQDLTAVSGGRLTAIGKGVFAPSDTTEIDLYRNNTQPVFSLLFTNTASHTLTVQMSKCAFSNGTVIDQTAPFIKVSANFRGINNTTDAGPVKFVLLNNLAAASYN